MKRLEDRTPLEMLQSIPNLCKIKGEVNWSAKSEGSAEIAFNFIANMIDSYVAEQDKGSEGANQDG